MTITIHQGDCIAVMRTMADESVDCIVTSPPYFGLRDYGVDGQIGLEASPRAFIDKMVEVFEECRRILKPRGTLWMNMGDSYAGSWGAQSRGDYYPGTLQGGNMTYARTISAHPKRKNTGSTRNMPGIKPKDMMGMPWRLAFALQDAGWYLRQDIIWSKPNPMPESITDRCTKSHEYIFLMSKNSRYHFDAAAIREPVSQSTHARLSQDVQNQIGSERAAGGKKTNGNMKAVARKGNGVGFGHGTDGEKRGRGRVKDNESFDSSMAIMPDDRNKRSVWEVVKQGFKEAHFATFPPKLIEPCILAGCPVGGIVFDPFFGAGTTGLVADRLQRHCVGIELNPAYIEIAERRIKDEQGMFSCVTIKGGENA